MFEEASRANLMKHLMDNIRDNIYFMDRAGRIIMINEAGARWLGFNAPEDVIGKTDLDIFSNEHGGPLSKMNSGLWRPGFRFLAKKNGKPGKMGMRPGSLLPRCPFGMTPVSLSEHSEYPVILQNISRRKSGRLNMLQRTNGSGMPQSRICLWLPSCRRPFSNRISGVSSGGSSTGTPRAILPSSSLLWNGGRGSVFYSEN